MLLFLRIRYNSHYSPVVDLHKMVHKHFMTRGAIKKILIWSPLTFDFYFNFSPPKDKDEYLMLNNYSTVTVISDGKLSI